MKKIGILGSGDVAKTLGNGFITLGYPVMLGTGNPQKLSDWKEQAGNLASTGSFADAARFGEVIVLAVKGTAAISVVNSAGIDNLAGKTVLDATNPIAEAAPEDGVLRFFTDANTSLMEQLQGAAPEARFVKAFNSVGNASMFRPSFEGRPSMFICGNSEVAKKEATEILDAFGWQTEDFGSVKSARAIEALCMLWCIPGFLRNEWTHAFKVYHKAR